MKKLIIITFLMITALSFKSEAETRFYQGGMNLFYSQLSPYGTWIELDAGVYCWRPTILSIGWAPYVQGRWEWTSYGWYWDSYEPFGYIVYHYGRWYYDDYYGWIWIPDDQWAPAWVEWRYDNDYIGWCPLPPYASFYAGVGIRFTYSYHSPFYHWHFVTFRYFNDPYVYHHFAGPKYKYRIYERTRYRTNYGYNNGYVVNRGIDYNFVRSRSGQNIIERRVEIVHDLGSLRNRTGGERNNSVIRTFIPNRDELNRNANTRNFKIEKSDRRTSLDISKIRLSERENVKRNDNQIRQENIIRNDNKVIRENNNRTNDRNRIGSRNIQERKIESNRKSNKNNYNPVERNNLLRERKPPVYQNKEQKKQERIYYPGNRFQPRNKSNNTIERNRTPKQKQIVPRKENTRKNSNGREKSNNTRKRN